MRTSIWKLTVVMLLGIVSFSSCGDDDDETNTQEQDLVINLSKEHEVVEIGNTIQLVAGFSPSDAPNKAHTWTSENPQIATVDETGKVKAISVGTTKITVTALVNKATATCTVEVVDKIIPVTSVTLNSKEETISVGSAIQLTATVSPTTATNKNIVWTSSNNAVATVDGNGLVKGLSVGSANITAAAGGKSAVCAITVTEKSVDFSNIEFTVQADGSLLVSGTVKPVGVNVSEIGACFSTETNPTIEHNKHVLTTTGLTVNSEISDLAPNSYYTRLYAKEGNTIYYGKSMIVKVPEKFSAQFKLYKSTWYIKIEPYQQIITNEYSLHLSIHDNENYYGGVSACYGIAPNPEITDNITNIYRYEKYGPDRYVSLYNLKKGTTYFIRAFSMKNGKPIYYPEEASFTTIGEDTKIDLMYEKKEGYKYYYYSLNYTLPEKGTYKVTSVKELFLNAYLCKVDNPKLETELYVKDGSGKIYLVLSQSNRDGRIIFENIDTGTQYELLIRK